MFSDDREDIVNVITNLTASAAKATELSLAPFRLSILEYGILGKCLTGEANTVTELSLAFPVGIPAISRMVSRLVDRELVSRQRLPNDRRTVRLCPTDKGVSLWQRLDERLKSDRDLLRNVVSVDERAAFAAIARKITATFEVIIERHEGAGRSG